MSLPRKQRCQPLLNQPLIRRVWMGHRRCFPLWYPALNHALLNRDTLRWSPAAHSTATVSRASDTYRSAKILWCSTQMMRNWAMANATGLTMIPTAQNIQNIPEAIAHYFYVNMDLHENASE